MGPRSCQLLELQTVLITVIISVIISPCWSQRPTDVRTVRLCQGQNVTMSCDNEGRKPFTMSIGSITFIGMTAEQEGSLPDIQPDQCSSNQTECKRDVREEDVLEGELKYITEYVLGTCQYRDSCNFIVPTWYIAKGPMGADCAQQTAYLLRLLVYIECYDPDVFNATAPTLPPSTPDWRTTTLSPEVLKQLLSVPLFHNKPLTGEESIILAVAISFGVVIFFIILIVFICYDIYRKNRNEAKQHLKEQRPKRKKSWYDTVRMFAMGDAWKDVDNAAIGEHTGFKPNETVTIDRTLDRNDRSAPPQYPGMENSTLPRVLDGGGGRGMAMGGHYSNTMMHDDQDSGCDFSTPLPEPPTAAAFEEESFDHFNQSGTLPMSASRSHTAMMY